jgi:energy-coupling factor transport system ATP-binding protein
MVMQPKILLLDEPTAQLDPIAAANFISTLQKLNHELGLTILLVEHRLEEVFPIADRVLMLTRGKLVYQDCPQNISFYFKQNFSEQNRLNQNPFKHMEAALPSAMRIYNALQNEDSLQSDTLQTDIECPLTVKEGRDYIIKNFDNQIDTVEELQPQQKNKTVLELKQVWFRYEKEIPDILRGVNLSVYEGENLCILGGNGSGKTTTLGIAAGLLKEYQGTVLLHGKKIGKYDEKSLYRHNLALLPQNPQTVFLEQTVQKDFLEICKSMEYKKEEWNDRIQAVAEKMDIAHLLEQHPYDLSGGEQQKAALAKMLLLQPKILLLDEPTKGIDAHSKIKLSEILKKLKADGITLITVTHDVEFAAANADRCAMLFDGEVVSVDTPRAFFANNNFYTTAANRIARGQYTNAVLCEDVIALCKANGRKDVSSHA